MRTPVAHGDKDIVFIQSYARLIDLFAADVHFDFGIFDIFAVTKQDHVRIIVLNDFGFFVVYDVDNGERGISHLALRTDRKRCGNGFDAVFERQTVCHHGRDDLRG